MNHIDRGFFLEMKKIKHNVRTAEPNRGEFSYLFEVANSVEAMTVILLQKKYRLFSIY